MRFLIFIFLTFTYIYANIDSNSSHSVIKIQEVEEDDFEEFGEYDQNQDEIFDPLIGYNRWMTSINDSLMLNVIEPLSNGYGYVVPEGGRKSINNFFRNLYYPVSFINNILQLEIVDSSTETARFVINSTVGILGLFDPAKEWFGIEPKVEDFGQTLGFYGVGSGFPVVLPFFGQRNLRDLLGTFADGFVDPVYHVDDRFYNLTQEEWQSILIKGYDNFNEYSLTPGAYPSLTEDAVDLYPLLRDAYEQHRNQLIKE